MAKGSSGGKSSSWRNKTNTVTPGAGRLIDAIQSGKYQKMDYEKQSKLYDDAAFESQRLNIKDAEERYTPEQLQALAYYHSSLFDDMNTSLRNGGDGGKYTKTLDGMFDHTLEKPVVVYRGTEKAPIRGADKAFQSTSLSAAKAEYFTNGSKHLHAYRLPAGTKIIYLGGSEEEIILPRGFNLSKYRIK